MANEASSGVIIHLPTSKAQIVSPSQRFLHPLLPFLANTACPCKINFYTLESDTSKIKHNQASDGEWKTMMNELTVPNQ